MHFHVIKEDDLFLVCRPDGEVPDPVEDSFGYGLYTRDTRMLSRLTFSVRDVSWRLLHADTSANYQAVYRYSSGGCGNQADLSQQTLFLTRRRFVTGNDLVEEGIIENFSNERITLDMVYQVAADFRDLFEVRGYSPADLHRTISCAQSSVSLVFSYVALDGVACKTTLDLHVLPEEEDVQDESGVNAQRDAHQDAREERKVSTSVDHAAGQLSFGIAVPARGKRRWFLRVRPEVAGRLHPNLPNGAVHASQEHTSHRAWVSGSPERMAQQYADWMDSVPRVDGDEGFASWYERGMRDVRMLLTHLGYGPFPVAGVPWYAVPFGRDSLITALEILICRADIARGTLATLAALQGVTRDARRDEQPGKIIHELRVGELTRIGELPFGPYYGSVDATPLFLCLAAEYLAWTGDLAFIRALLPVVERAFHWMDHDGDRDGDGWIEYFREAERGIANQGWKDSGDAVSHVDGRLAEPPVALCEVQAYAHRAHAAWARIYRLLGAPDRAEAHHRRARQLAARFLETFWLASEGLVAFGLDAEKRPIGTAASNMGHCLWGGVLPADVARQVADRLLQPDMFSGYGIRTLSTREVRYNPLSYHNGTVWPHDNAIILAGFAQYGLSGAVAKLAGALLRVSAQFEMRRLPELFGGLSASEAPHPVPYPVSCSPQAWAAATPAMVLQSVLGMQPDVPQGRVFIHPVLPEGCDRLLVQRIRLGEGNLSLDLRRDPFGRTQVKVLENTTGCRVEQGVKGGMPWLAEAGI